MSFFTRSTQAKTLVDCVTRTLRLNRGLDDLRSLDDDAQPNRVKKKPLWDQRRHYTFPDLSEKLSLRKKERKLKGF